MRTRLRRTLSHATRRARLEALTVPPGTAIEAHFIGTDSGSGSQISLKTLKVFKEFGLGVETHDSTYDATSAEIRVVGRNVTKGYVGLHRLERRLRFITRGCGYQVSCSILPQEDRRRMLETNLVIVVHALEGFRYDVNAAVRDLLIRRELFYFRPHLRQMEGGETFYLVVFVYVPNAYRLQVPDIVQSLEKDVKGVGEELGLDPFHVHLFPPDTARFTGHIEGQLT